MSVDIDVNLEIDKSDIGKIKGQLESLDDADIDFDLNDILDGSFDEIELDLDKNHLKKQISGAFDDIEADFDLPAMGDIGQADSPPDTVQRGQLARVIQQLNAIKRILKAQTANINPEDLAIKGFGDRDNIELDDGEGRLLTSAGQYKQPTFNTLADMADDGYGLDPIPLRDKFSNAEYEDVPRLPEPTPSTLEGVLFDMHPADDATNSRINIPRIPTPDVSSGAVFNAHDKDIAIPEIGGTVRKFAGLNRQSKRLSGHINKVDGALGVVGRTMNKLRPTIGQIYSIVALLIPVLIGFAGAAGAVAIALGGLATAGLAIGVLGALGGEADTLSGSLNDLEEQMQNFKQGLFQAIQPAADTLAPLFEMFLNTIVNQASRLNDELAGFAQFGNLFQRGIVGSVDLVERLFQEINNLAPILSGLGVSIGKLIKTKLPGFFRAAVIEAQQNKDVLSDTLNVFWDLLRVVYQVSIFILNLISALRPLEYVFSTIADLLGNRIIRSLLVFLAAVGAIIGTVVIMSKILGTLIGVMFALNGQLILQGSLLGALKATWAGTWIASAIKGISGLITMVMSLNGALGVAATLATVLASALTLGAAGAIAIGAGSKIMDIATGNSVDAQPTSTGAATGRKPGSNDVTMNFYGDMENQSRQKMVDAVNEVNGQRDLSKGRFSEGM